MLMPFNLGKWKNHVFNETLPSLWIFILHREGTFANYLRLSQGVSNFQELELSVFVTGFSVKLRPLTGNQPRQ